MGCFVCLSHDPDPLREKPGEEQKEPILPKKTNSISLEDFNIEKVIGKGAFGKVFLVSRKVSGEIFAMKSLRKEMIEKRNQKDHTQTERQILGGVENPFIVQLRFAFQTEDKLYMVMDYINGGELFFHLRKAKTFTEERTRFYAAEIALALEYLHSQGIIYRDLKPENVLLDKDGHLKITDFGLSKQFADDQKKKAFSFCGTPEYIAPEILKGIGHDHSVDFWSLGALIYEMLAGSPPFYSRNKDQMFKNMLTKPVTMKPYFSPAACDIISKLLQVDPRKRLNLFEELKSHEFFEGANLRL